MNTFSDFQTISWLFTQPGPRCTTREGNAGTCARTKPAGSAQHRAAANNPLLVTAVLAIRCCLLTQPISTSVTWELHRSLEPSSLGVVLAGGCMPAWRWDRKRPICSTAAAQSGCKRGDCQLQPNLGMFHIAKLSKILLGLAPIFHIAS